MKAISFSNIKIIGILISIFCLGISSPLLGQSEDGMLIFQVDGNRYMRKNFNKENELLSYQTIEIDTARSIDGKIETKMTVVTYEKDGTLKGTSQTNLVCSPDSRQVLMGVFPFAGNKSKTSMIVKMSDNTILYPTDWKRKSALKNFNFSLDFKGGAVGFFGTKSTVSIANRKVMFLEKTFGVSGNITIKAYVLGIKVSTIKYDYFEEIDIEKGIVRQKFTEDNGEYFTVEIIE